MVRQQTWGHCLNPHGFALNLMARDTSTHMHVIVPALQWLKPATGCGHTTLLTYTVEIHPYLLLLLFLQVKEYNRNKKWCLIKGCKAKAQKNSPTGHQLSAMERKKALSIAKLAIPGRARPRDVGQQKLSFTRTADPTPTLTTSQSRRPPTKDITTTTTTKTPTPTTTTTKTPTPTTIPSRSQSSRQPPLRKTTRPTSPETSTREWEKFPITEGKVDDFRQWLQTIDGRLKSQTRADAIAVDVAKLIKFANREQVEWDLLLDRREVGRFCKELEGAIGGSGRVQKLESLSDALRYYHAEVVTTGVPDQRVSLMQDVLRDWRHSYRKIKRKEDVTRLEKCSDEKEITKEEVSRSVTVIHIILLHFSSTHSCTAPRRGSSWMPRYKVAKGRTTHQRASTG